MWYVLQLLTGKVNKIVKWLYYDSKEQALQLFFRLVLLKPKEYMQIQHRIHQCCSDQWNSNFHPKSIIHPDNWHQYLQTYDSV